MEQLNVKEMYLEFCLETIIIFLIGIVIGIHYIDKNVNLYHAPSSSSVKNKIIYDNDTMSCYKLIPKVHICPINYSMSQK